MDGKSVWRSFSEKNGKKFELLPDIIEKKYGMIIKEVNANCIKILS